MIRANEKMIKIIASNPFRGYVPVELMHILDAGISEMKDSIFLNFFYKANPHLKESDFQDKTHYECFINGFYVNDYCRKNGMKYLFPFINKLKKVINKNCKDSPVIIIVSINKDDIHVTFHKQHFGEPKWIEENQIDGNKDAVLIWT